MGKTRTANPTDDKGKGPKSIPQTKEVVDALSTLRNAGIVGYGGDTQPMEVEVQTTSKIAHDHHNITSTSKKTNKAPRGAPRTKKPRTNKHKKGTKKIPFAKKLAKMWDIVKNSGLTLGTPLDDCTDYFNGGVFGKNQLKKDQNQKEGDLPPLCFINKSIAVRIWHIMATIIPTMDIEFVHNSKTDIRQFTVVGWEKLRTTFPELPEVTEYMPFQCNGTISGAPQSEPYRLAKDLQGYLHSLVVYHLVKNLNTPNFVAGPFQTVFDHYVKVNQAKNGILSGQNKKKRKANNNIDPNTGEKKPRKGSMEALKKENDLLKETVAAQQVTIASLEKYKQKKRNQLSKLDKEMESKKEQIRTLTEQKNDSELDNVHLRATIGTLEDEKRGFTQQIKTLENQIKTLENRIKTLENQIEDKEEAKEEAVQQVVRELVRQNTRKMEEPSDDENEEEEVAQNNQEEDGSDSSSDEDEENGKDGEEKDGESSSSDEDSSSDESDSE